MFVLCSLMSMAQQSTYRAVEYTFGEWNTYYQKYNWSEKEYVDIPIVVTPKTITIYSQVVQHYKVLSDAVRIDHESAGVGSVGHHRAAHAPVRA